jgi:hypothetical protein
MLCQSIEGDITRCSIPSCGKFFHRKCLKNGLWPQARFSETQLTCPGTYLPLVLNFQTLLYNILALHVSFMIAGLNSSPRTEQKLNFQKTS